MQGRRTHRLVARPRHRRAAERQMFAQCIAQMRCAESSTATKWNFCLIVGLSAQLGSSSFSGPRCILVVALIHSGIFADLLWECVTFMFSHASRQK